MVAAPGHNNGRKGAPAVPASRITRHFGLASAKSSEDREVDEEEEDYSDSEYRNTEIRPVKVTPKQKPAKPRPAPPKPRASGVIVPERSMTGQKRKPDGKAPSTAQKQGGRESQPSRSLAPRQDVGVTRRPASTPAPEEEAAGGNFLASPPGPATQSLGNLFHRPSREDGAQATFLSDKAQQAVTLAEFTRASGGRFR